MKKLLAALMIVFVGAAFAYAADTKISAMTADTAPTSDDLIPTVDAPGSSPANKAVTLGNAITKAHGLTGDGYVLTLNGSNVMQASSSIGVTIGGFGASKVLCSDGSGNAVDCTNLTDAAFSSYVANSLFDAHTILYATSDNTPAALTVTEQTVVGRATSGNISAIAVDSDLASVSANHNTVPSAKAVKNKVQYKAWSFDPKAVCDGAVDRLFLMSAHGGQGIKIKQWKISFEADPTTEADLDLKRADAWIGVANAAVMDVLDTTNGAASETTEANINSDAAVAEGKVIYLEFGTAYTEANHQIIFELWYYEVGN